MWPWEASVKDSTTQGPLREMRPIFFATFPEAWPENCSVPTVSKHRSCACAAADATTPIATLPLSVAEPARSHPIWNLPPHARRPPARVAPRHKPRASTKNKECSSACYMSWSQVHILPQRWKSLSGTCPSMLNDTSHVVGCFRRLR